MLSYILKRSAKLTHLLVLLSYLFQAVSPAFATMVEEGDGYTLKIKSKTVSKGGGVWPAIKLTLTKKEGDETAILEKLLLSPYGMKSAEEHIQELKDWKYRSLGFSYDLKGIGRIYVCWEGSLLINNLNFHRSHLSINTTGTILAKDMNGTALNLEGRDIFFGGSNTVNSLSMGFGKTIGPRLAHILPKSKLATMDLALEGGILLNQGSLTSFRSFTCHDAHLVNEHTMTADALHLEGGTLKNQGTLKAKALKARGMEKVNNTGLLQGDWDIESSTFINSGSISGRGSLKADILENDGLIGNKTSVFSVRSDGHNRGHMQAQKVMGYGTFTNHHHLETQMLDIASFLNQKDEHLCVTPIVKGESLRVTERVRQFINGRDSSINVKRLMMDGDTTSTRLITNDGSMQGEVLKLTGQVENKGEIEAEDFTWNGSTFKTHSFSADQAVLNGTSLENFGDFTLRKGKAYFSKFINKGKAFLNLTDTSVLHTITNNGDLKLRGGTAIVRLHNEEGGKVLLSHGNTLSKSSSKDHFEKVDASFVAQEANSWIRFKGPKPPSTRYGSFLAEVRVNDESHIRRVLKSNYDPITETVTLHVEVPKIKNGDRVELFYQTPEIDFEIVHTFNKGTLRVENIPFLYMNILNNTHEVFLKNSSLLLGQLNNQKTITLNGWGAHRFVDVKNDGTIQFKTPVYLENTSKWQKPGRIKGAFGVHVDVSDLDSLGAFPKSPLYVYGKQFNNTWDHVFSYPLHFLVEDFRNTYWLKAPELSVNAKTIHNDGTLEGRYVTVHATESGQNPGRLEATRRLDVDLPQINSLGTMISKKDLIFKTRDRTITLIEDQSWLNVGRNLHMELLNGNLKVEAKHAFPGDVKVKAGSFNLQGSLEAEGDLDVKTSGNIILETEKEEIQPLELLLKNLEKRTNDRGAFQYFIKHLSPTEEESVLFHLKRISGARVGAPQDLSLSQVLQWYGWSDVMRAIAEHLGLLNNPFGNPFGATGQRAPVHTTTLSTLKSKGHLALSGHNINNLGGQVRGDHSLTLRAIQNIINGSAYRTTRQDLNFHYTGGAPCLYAAPEERGNGSLLSTLGLFSLESGFSLQNNHGIMFAGGGLNMAGPHFMSNIGGQIVVVGDAHLEGGAFSNTRAATIELKSNQTTQEYVGSGPAILQVLGNLTLDFRNQIINFASDIMVGGAEYLKRARILNNDLSVSIWATQPSGQKPTTGVVNAPSLIPTISSSKLFDVTTPQEVINSGMISSPQIHVKGPRLLQIGSQDSTPRSSPRSSIRTPGGADRIPLVPYVRQLGEELRTIVGSLPYPQLPDITVVMDQNTRVTLSMPHLLSSPIIDALSLQRGYMEHYRKGYVFAHLSPIEHLIKLRDNARKMALQHGVKGPNWSPLMITDQEASKTSLPMLLYRLIIVNGEAVLSPEYWGPHGMINPFLLGNEPAAVGDEVFKSSDVQMTSVTGNVHGGNEVRLSGYEGFLGHRIERQPTPHGYKEKPVGGNITTDKEGEVGLQFSGPFGTKGGNIRAEDGEVTVQSNGMDLDTAVARTYHNNGETVIDNTTQHPLHIVSGDIRVTSSSHLNARAIQGVSTRTFNVVAQDDMSFPSAEDVQHFEQRTSDRDMFGSKSTRTEVSHSTTHQGMNVRAGELIGIHSIAGNIRATAPHFTAPKIMLDFENGALLLQAFVNTYFHQVVSVDSNPFFQTQSNSGSNSTIHGGFRFDGETSFTRARPIHMEVPESEQDSQTSRILRDAGATTSIMHDKFQSWDERKISMGPGLTTLIAIGVSMMMPGIGTGVTGAMLTKGAETLSTQAIIGMFNNGGNVFKTLEDMTSGDSLRSVATSMATAGLSSTFSELAGIPTVLKGDDYVDHLQNHMVTMAAQMPVGLALSGKSFEEVFQDSLECAAANLVGSYGAAKVGQFFKKGNITALEQKLAHAAVGAASAKLKGGDPLSGALGAVVGEAVGETLRTELEESGIAQDHPDYDRQVDRAVNIARFTAASVACGLGQDAEAASFAAGNAARFNAFAFDERIKSIIKFFSPTEEDLEEGESSSSIAHKTGEKLLDHYAQFADWAIEYMEKNPDSAKALDVAMMAMGAYSQVMMELPETIITGDATRMRQAHEQLSDVQANATKEIKQYLKDAGYSREEQVTYAHALAVPVILLKTLTRTKGGASQGVSKELLTSLKEFKQSHGALKAKSLKGKSGNGASGKGQAPSSKKRGTRTDPEAIEPTITPIRKSQRIANKTSPSDNNSDNLGLERPHQSPYYTSIFKAQLEKQKHYPGKLDKVHFQEANKQLYNSMQSDLNLKASLNRLYPELEKAIAPNAKGVFPSKPPTSIGLTWHHDAYNAGRMDLILRSHHTSAGPVQHNLHPNQKGGMELWGGGRKNKDK